MTSSIIFLSFFSSFKLSLIIVFSLFSRLQCLVNFVMFSEFYFSFISSFSSFYNNYFLFTYVQINFIKLRFTVVFLIGALQSGHFLMSFIRHVLQMLCPHGNMIIGILGGIISSWQIIQQLVYSYSATFLEIGHTILLGFYILSISFFA
jgi:hypothetical protein